MSIVTIYVREKDVLLCITNRKTIIEQKEIIVVPIVITVAMIALTIIVREEIILPHINMVKIVPINNEANRPKAIAPRASRK